MRTTTATWTWRVSVRASSWPVSEVTTAAHNRQEHPPPSHRPPRPRVSHPQGLRTPDPPRHRAHALDPPHPRTLTTLPRQWLKFRVSDGLESDKPLVAEDDEKWDLIHLPARSTSLTHTWRSLNIAWKKKKLSE